MNNRTFGMYDMFGNPIYFSGPNLSAEAIRQRAIIAQRKKEQAIAELNGLFDEINRKYFSQQLAPNSAGALLRDSISILRQELVQDITDRNDRSTLKCARQLDKTIATILDPKKSELRKRWEIEQFKNSARNSMFSRNTRHAIGLTSIVLGWTSIFVGFGCLIASIACPLLLIPAVALGIGGICTLLNADDMLRRSRPAYSKDHRGKEVKDHLFGLFHERKNALRQDRRDRANEAREQVNSANGLRA